MSKQNLYGKIYGKASKENIDSSQAQAKAAELKRKLGKYALYGTALLGTAALQEIPTAEAAINHNNSGTFTGATKNFTTGGGNNISIPLGTSSTSMKVFNSSSGNSFEQGNSASIRPYFLTTNTGYLKRLNTSDIVSNFANGNSGFFANNGSNGCDNDGGQNWLTNPCGYIGFKIRNINTGTDLRNGWIRVTFNCGPGGSTVIHEYAYEDVEGIPIQVGQTGAASNAGVHSCPTTTPEVPTLSEWGLINLAILLLTFGTVYLINPNFSLRKKVVE